MYTCGPAFFKPPSGGGGFPLTLPNLVMWLDGADSSTIVQSGGLISQWSDKSPQLLHWVQPTGANQPTYQPTGWSNGNGCIYTGPGDPDIFSLMPVGSVNPLTLLPSSAATIFFVSVNDTESGNLGAPLTQFGSAGSSDHHPFSGTIYNGLAANTRYVIPSFTAGSLLIGQIYTIESNTAWHIDQGTTTLYSTSSTFGIGGTPLLAYSSFATHQWPGKIAEIIICGQLTSTQLTNTYNYLKAKWNTP